MNDFNSITSSKFYGESYLNKDQSTERRLSFFNIDIEPIMSDSSSHYLCTKCLEFPFIEFCKDMKNIRFTCSCFKNKKILIKDILDETLKYIFIKNNSSISYFLTDDEITDYHEVSGNGLMNKDKNKKYRGFDKYFNSNTIYEEDPDYEIIKFKDIEIDEEKINSLLEYINDNKEESYNNSTNKYSKSFEENKNERYKFKFIDERLFFISEEEENSFKKLISIIIYDYLNYPNFVHFFNIKNILNFLYPENNSNDIKEKEDNKINTKAIKNDEFITIEYANNISGSTKLFSKTFVQNNKLKVKIEIEGELLEIKSEYEFKTKDRIVKIRLILNENIFEINMLKMFSNCTNLIYINGISKLKKTKIINQNKMFYNCISLSSIPDFKDWKLSKDNNYLMFYNCISLAFFPLENEIIKYDDGFLGLLITKSFKINDEITIKNVIKDKKETIKIFGKEFQIKNKKEEIMIVDGIKNTRGIIAFYKDEKNEKENELIIYNRDSDREGEEIELKARIIIDNIEDIIEKNELDLSKWNTSSLTNMGYLFYNCKSLKALPDISSWNTSNVTNMQSLFHNCESLIKLPDISKWNTSNVIKMKSLFNSCQTLTELPDISKWNTSKVMIMKFLFNKCESLKSLPDISNWNTNNVIKMNFLFCKCRSLKKLPDISKWNTSNVINIESLFDQCESLTELPDISKWNIKNVIFLNHLFYKCKKLKKLPDISKWDTNNAKTIKCLFYGCESLQEIPDISNWNTKNITNMSYLFYKCKSLKNIPDITKWNINNVINMKNLFNK